MKIAIENAPVAGTISPITPGKGYELLTTVCGGTNACYAATARDPGADGLAAVRTLSLADGYFSYKTTAARMCYNDVKEKP